MGKTFIFLFFYLFNTVHPHTRGENSRLITHWDHARRYTPTHVGKTDCQLVSDYVANGTPPHTWGKPPTFTIHNLNTRYTPTHVGKTPIHILTSYPNPVHPHTRGENVMKFAHFADITGTPPHTWGKRFSQFFIL